MFSTWTWANAFGMGASRRCTQLTWSDGTFCSSRLARRLSNRSLCGRGLAADANETAEALRCCGPIRYWLMCSRWKAVLLTMMYLPCLSYNLGGVWQILKGKKREIQIDIDGEILEEPF